MWANSGPSCALGDNLFSLDSKTSRRAWTGFAVAAVLTSFAGVSAFPAAAAEPLAPAITNPIEGMVFHDLPYIDGTGAVLAATGVSGSGIVLVLSGLLLLGGAIALVPGLRRRTRH